MDDYLSKPVRFHELATLLARWLGRSPGAAPAPAPPRAPVPALATGLTANLLDVSVLAEWRALAAPGQPSALRPLLATYFESAEELAGEVAAGVARADAAAIKRAAHSLKSSSASMGAISLSRLCLELERLSAKGQMTTEIEALASELQALHAASVDALRAACRDDLAA
jgi:HPt (histidine-containing phosphotransfer) domain-containing protein